ncbi:MAG: hypothetical protein ACXVB6_14755 [Mucilaginibacter sp.]
MAILLQRLCIKDFDPNNNSHHETDDSFKIYTLIEKTDVEIKNCTFEDINNLKLNDRRDARTTFIKFFKHAINGPPLEKTFDDKQCHIAHDFSYEQKSIKILRLRLSGDIRVYFLYGPNRSIFVLKTIAKRKQKLNKSEILDLETNVKKIIDCAKNNQITIVERENNDI